MICRKKTPNVCFYYEPTGGIYRSKRTVCGLKDKCPPIHILPQLIELWGLNVQTEVESRKNLEKVSGK